MATLIVGSSRIERSLHSNVHSSDGRTQDNGNCDTIFKSNAPRTTEIEKPTLPNPTQRQFIPNVPKTNEIQQLTVPNPTQLCFVPNLHVSSAVEKYSVKQIAKRTVRNSETGLNLFIQLCIALCLAEPQKHHTFLTSIKNQCNSPKSHEARAILFKNLFLFDEISLNLLSETQQTRAAYFMKEFAVKYKRSGKRAKEVHSQLDTVSPSAMEGYLLSRKRVMRSELCVKEFDIMKLPGVKDVIQNKFRELQSHIHILESQNNLSIQDLYIIYTFLNEDANKNAKSYRDRLVIFVGIATDLRTTGLQVMTRNLCLYFDLS